MENNDGAKCRKQAVRIWAIIHETCPREDGFLFSGAEARALGYLVGRLSQSLLACFPLKPTAASWRERRSLTPKSVTGLRVIRHGHGVAVPAKHHY